MEWGSDLGLLNLRSPVLDLGMRQLLRFQGSFQLALQALLRCSAGIHSLCACRRRLGVTSATSEMPIRITIDLLIEQLVEVADGNRRAIEGADRRHLLQAGSFGLQGGYLICVRAACGLEQMLRNGVLLREHTAAL